MKICPNCSAALDDDAAVCEICGAEQEEVTEEVLPEEIIPEEETAEENTAPAEAACAEPVELPAEQFEAPAPKKTYAGLIVGLILAALLAGALIVAKGQYDRGFALERQVAIDAGAHHINAHSYPSWSIHYATAEDGTVSYDYLNSKGETVALTQAQIDKLKTQVVATCGDWELTNEELQYYYASTLYSVYNSTYGTLMDPYHGLDEQQTGVEENQTWQQYVMDHTIKTFYQNAALYRDGMANGYTLNEEAQNHLDTFNLEETAAANGYTDVDAFLQVQYGPMASQAGFEDFYAKMVYAKEYASYLDSQIVVTDADVEAFYDENAMVLQMYYNVQKIDRNVVTVRHILIKPEETTDANGNAAISSEAWTAAKNTADAVYQQWLDGEQTEESFIALAETNSADTSASNGGLIPEFGPGQMVPAFNDWSFEEGRKYGDHGIVETEYGYHIMFFVEEGDYIYWRNYCEPYAKNELLTAQVDELIAAASPAAQLHEAVLMDATVPTVPAAPAAAE